MKDDFLRSLGLLPQGNYTTTEIKKAWRKECKEHHPDKGGDPKKFHEVTHAYKMLIDASYRHSEEVEMHGPKGGLNINLTVPINFEDAFFGREILVTFNVIELDDKSTPLTDKKFEVICAKIKIPAGQFAYSYMVKGKGLKRGDKQGDTYFVFQAMPNKKFKMDPSGKDTVATEEVPLDMMLRGGEVDVMTMWGIHKIKIPPGSKEGDTIYVPNCGVSKIGRHRVHLKSIYPSKEELKNNSNWKGLNIDWGVEDKGSPDAMQDEEYEKIFLSINRFSSGSATGKNL